MSLPNQLVPSPWTVHVMEKPSQKSRPQPPPPHSEIIILEGSTCLSIKTLTKKTYPERPSGSLAVLRDAQFHDNNKVWNELGNSVWLLGHHVTMAWIMQHHIEVRISLNPWTQSSSVFPSAKELAVFILCCPINKNYSPLHCWLRTCCIQSTSSTRSLFANVVALGICIHLWIFTYFL